MNIYLAAPIVGITDTQENEISTVFNICKYLTDFTHGNTFDPRKLHITNAWGMSQNEWARAVFAQDTYYIQQADWLVVCDYGRSLTSGTAWEAGYGFGIGKNVLIIHMYPSTEKVDYSLMLRGCSSNYCYYSDFVKTFERSYDKASDQLKFSYLILNTYFFNRGKEFFGKNEVLN